MQEQNIPLAWWEGGVGAKANAEVKENNLMEAHAKVNSTTVMVGWWGGWAKGKGESKGKCNGKT